MIHAFILLVYLGDNLQKDSMYFYSVDRCMYFANILNKQPKTPKGKYTASCEVRYVEDKDTNIYY